MCETKQAMWRMVNKPDKSINKWTFDVPAVDMTIAASCLLSALAFSRRSSSSFRVAYGVVQFPICLDYIQVYAFNKGFTRLTFSGGTSIQGHGEADKGR